MLRADCKRGYWRRGEKGEEVKFGVPDASYQGAVDEGRSGGERGQGSRLRQ